MRLAASGGGAGLAGKLGKIAAVGVAARLEGRVVATTADDVAKVAKPIVRLLDRGRRVLGDAPLNSKSLDELYQAGKLSMDEARALAKDVGWKSADGRWIYPPNNGFHNGFREVIFKKGDQIIIDRYGDVGGKFASPLGEAKGARALPPDTDFSSGNYHIYKVEGDIKVNVGNATPWFDQPGGVTQYQLPQSIDNLLFNDMLKELRR
jgi:Tuberculosis necrotizing toxin